MSTTRWQPLSEVRSEFSRLQNEMDRLFGRWGGNSPRVFSRGTYPPLNVWEDQDKVFVEAELPGFEMNDIEIFVTGENQLSLKGECKPPKVEGGTWHRQERGCGTFARMLELPCLVDSDKVTAEFKNGVLTITLPKHPGVKPRRIEVKSS